VASTALAARKEVGLPPSPASTSPLQLGPPAQSARPSRPAAVPRFMGIDDTADSSMTPPPTLLRRAASPFHDSSMRRRWPDGPLYWLLGGSARQRLRHSQRDDVARGRSRPRSAARQSAERQNA